MKIEIYNHFSGWQPVDREQAARFVSYLLDNLPAIPTVQRPAYIEAHRLRGCTVSDLLGEKETPPDPVRQEFMRLLDSMTAEQRNELFAFMLRLKRERGK